MKKGRALRLVGSTPRLSSLRRLETVMGVARVRARLIGTPQPPPLILKRSLAAATGVMWAAWPYSPNWEAVVGVA